MSSKREGNDRNKAGFGPKSRGPKPRPHGGSRGGDGPREPRVWSPKPEARPAGDRAERSGRGSRDARADSADFLWGRHAVMAALENPARRGAGRLFATPDRAAEVETLAGGRTVEVLDGPALARLLPQGAVHQGLAFKAKPLDGVSLEEMAEAGPKPGTRGVILMLDQITDPQNVGAIFRSALAFGARGVVMQERHSPALSGALAKAAAGATERLPFAKVTNLSRALETLAELGWRAVGLDGSATETLDQALDDRPTVLVMGSEGDGIRRLVAEHCDALARIPMPGGFESLNVSNAAAIALYEASRART